VFERILLRLFFTAAVRARTAAAACVRWLRQASNKSAMKLLNQVAANSGFVARAQT
jgi:hypothetical protein